MGDSKYGTVFGPYWVATPTGYNIMVNRSGALAAIQSGALALETAVSTSLTVAATGASGATSMDANTKATLSASYSSLSGVIV